MRGLYAITPDENNDVYLADKVSAAIKGGARYIQYRHTTAPPPMRQRQATLLASICEQLGATLIINNDITLAHQCGAGVHLGQGDAAVATARAQLGDGAIIGATCHNSLALAQSAQDSGASYIAVGCLFPSPSKPTALPCTLLNLTHIKNNITLPLVAIGGITLSNAAEVIAAGADSIAVIHALFTAQHITTTAQHFSRLFR